MLEWMGTKETGDRKKDWQQLYWRKYQSKGCKTQQKIFKKKSSPEEESLGHSE